MRMNRLLNISIALLSLFAFEAMAHGTPNGNHCYNGWHYYQGACHVAHASGNDIKILRFIKNGGHCYNGWYLDRKDGKCQKRLGWFESEDDRHLPDDG